MRLSCFFRSTSFFSCLLICFNSFNSAAFTSAPFPTVEASTPGVADPDCSTAEGKLSPRDAPSLPILSMYSSNHSKCLHLRRSWNPHFRWTMNPNSQIGTKIRNWRGEQQIGRGITQISPSPTLACSRIWQTRAPDCRSGRSTSRAASGEPYGGNQGT